MSPWFCLMLLSGVAAEVTTPASLLGPRHFNYHPYEQYLKEVEPTKQGPVLFPNDAPPPPRPPLIVTSRPLIDSISRSDLNPAPQNNSLAQQSVINRVSFKPQFLGRDYQGFGLAQDYQEQQPTLAPIFRAISDHANQNLNQHKLPVYDNKIKQIDYPKNYISNNINNDDNSNYDKAQNYAFSYTVRDQKTGDDFSHSQHSSGSATNGEYRVRLPDGRMQIVSYTADENGYNADVRYDDDKTTGNSIDYGVNRNYNDNYKGNHNNHQNYVSNYGGIGNENYNRNQNSHNSDYNGNQNYNYDYKDAKAYDVKSINDLTDNNYAREDIKPVVEPVYKDDYAQYGDSKELYANDYSLEYEDKYNKYDPHKSKFTAFSGPKNPKFVPRKSYSTASTVRPSYEELQPLFVQKKPFKNPQPTNEYLYSNIPISINPSTTPSPYFDATTERVVIIGTTKPNLYTNIRSSLAPIPVTPVPKYSQNVVTTPRSFLVSTITSIANLGKNIDFSGAQPVLSNTFIDKINKYLSYK